MYLDEVDESGLSQEQKIRLARLRDIQEQANMLTPDWFEGAKSRDDGSIIRELSKINDGLPLRLAFEYELDRRRLERELSSSRRTALSCALIGALAGLVAGLMSAWFGVCLAERCQANPTSSAPAAMPSSAAIKD